MATINNVNLCDWPGCKQHAGPSHFIHGNAYCYDHYSSALEKHFLEIYTDWDGCSKPNKKFLSLFSRYMEDVYRDEEIPGGLTKGRLNNRGENVRKTKNGLNFSIERHKNAWKHPERMHEVVQRWSFNIKQKKLKLVREKILDVNQKFLYNIFSRR